MAHAHVSAKGYFGTWVALIILTTATFLLSGVIHGDWGVISGLLFAVAKGNLVLWIFMHLAEEPFSSRAAFLVSVSFVVLLLGMILGDINFRPLLEVSVPQSR